MRKDKDRSYNKFLRTLLAIQLDQLRAFLVGTPAATLVDGKPLFLSEVYSPTT